MERLNKDEHLHFKLYKPFGYLSQLTSGEERQLKKKKFLSELYDFPDGSMPIGRLDEKSEGLLVMTTDGKLSDHVNSSGMEKEYWAQLDGVIDLSAIEKLRMGVDIGIFGRVYTTKPCHAEFLKEPTTLPLPNPKLRVSVHRPSSWIKIVLTEGKFRQIRKMTAAVGYPTLRLIRVRIGDIRIDSLLLGETIPIQLSKKFSKDEYQKLR